MDSFYWYTWNKKRLILIQMDEALINKNNQHTTQRMLAGCHYDFIKLQGLCISQTGWNTAMNADHLHLSPPFWSTERFDNAIDCVISGNTEPMASRTIDPLSGGTTGVDGTTEALQAETDRVRSEVRRQSASSKRGGMFWLKQWFERPIEKKLIMIINCVDLKCDVNS